MTDTSRPTEKPRKMPVQDRSADTLNAFCEAAIGVLLEGGVEKLTTTRVAAKAGISVGALYQYFPNKQSLLYAVLEAHLNQVIGAVEKACKSSRDLSIDEFVEKVVVAFLLVKTRRLDVTLAIYSLCNDTDRRSLANRADQRMARAIVATLEAIPLVQFENVELTAQIFIAMISGTSRVILESEAPRQIMPALRKELITQGVSYLKTSVTSTTDRRRPPL